MIYLLVQLILLLEGQLHTCDRSSELVDVFIVEEDLLVREPTFDPLLEGLDNVKLLAGCYKYEGYAAMPQHVQNLVQNNLLRCLDVKIDVLENKGDTETFIFILFEKLLNHVDVLNCIIFLVLQV